MFRSRQLRIFVGLSIICLPLLLHFFWIRPSTTLTNLPIPSGIPGYTHAQLPRIANYDDPRLQRRSGESTVKFADRIVKVINLATYHCSVNDSGQSWWTWLVAKAGLIDPAYGVLSTSTFICGFCHQRAFVLTKALRRGGVADANVYGLNGHVITIYSANGKRYAIDADYGVRSFEFPENANIEADVIAAHYLSEAPGYSPQVYSQISNFYVTSEDNGYYSRYEYLDAMAVSQRKILSFEPVIGYAISAFGFGIIFGPALVTMHRKRRS